MVYEVFDIMKAT